MSENELLAEFEPIDIEVWLNPVPSRWYHLGLPGAVACSTLSEANESRDWRSFADLAQHLIGRARTHYATEDLGHELEQTVYALDSTTIDLCLSLFPWARLRPTKAAIKLRTLIEVRGPIPSFVNLTSGRGADVHAPDQLVLEPGSFYIMDRYCLDRARLDVFVMVGAFFVTRAKRGMRFDRIEARPVDRRAGLRCDQIVWLSTRKGTAGYPEKLRRVGFRDPETDLVLVFLTNPNSHRSGRMRAESDFRNYGVRLSRNAFAIRDFRVIRGFNFSALGAGLYPQ